MKNFKVTAGPKLRRWYGETEKLTFPKDGGEPPEEEAEEDPDLDGTKEAVLVTDADTPLGELLVLQLVLSRCGPISMLCLVCVSSVWATRELCAYNRGKRPSVHCVCCGLQERLLVMTRLQLCFRPSRGDRSASLKRCFRRF